MATSKRRTLFLLLGAALLTAGCGSGNVSRPAGTIVDGGVPVERAAIVFSGRIEDQEIEISGLTDAEGRYRLDYGVHDGLPVGPVEVSIERALLRDGSPVPPDEEGMHMLRTGEALSKRYEYGVELAPGSPQLDFDLAEASEEQVTVKFGTSEY